MSIIRSYTAVPCNVVLISGPVDFCLNPVFCKNPVDLEVTLQQNTQSIEGNGFETFQSSLLLCFCWLFWADWPSTKPGKIQIKVVVCVHTTSQ